MHIPDLTTDPIPPPPNSTQVYDSADWFVSMYKNYLPASAAGNVDDSLCSCGISQLNGLSGTTPAAIVDKVIKERHPHDTKKIREAFVIFSDKESSNGGNRLYKYIKDNNLGNIMEFGPKMNPNTGNMIKLWVWEPPHESLHPDHKCMPVYGKKLVKRSDGLPSYYVDDSRFKSNIDSAAREA